MTGVVQYSDDAARRVIATALDETVVVEAAAGTGKTTQLIRRILRVIAEGRADVRGVVAVTFTEKAAGELKLRLRKGLEEERRESTDPVIAKRLAAAIEHLEEACVSTIHGFCADMLRERPVEARIDPLFRVLTEGEAERLFNRAFEGWFQQQLAEPGEGIRRSLRRPGRASGRADMDEDGPVERLRRAAFSLTEWRDFRGAWARPLFDRRGGIARIVELVHTCADRSAGPSYINDNLFLDTAPVRRLRTELEGLGVSDSSDVARLPDSDLDTLESQFIELRRNRDFKRARKGTGPTYRKGVTRAQVLEARDVLIAALADFQVAADADLAAALHTELLGCLDAYEELKAREGALDFLDLLLSARDLVRRDSAVRRSFQQRFTHLFVDEFQDTDPLQAEILFLLAADDPEQTDWERVVPVPGKLFVVGDPKQSIYRFRRADVDTYLRACERLKSAGATFVELRRSFRSVANIQRAINMAFEPVMGGDAAALQARHVPLEPWRDDTAGQPSVIALPVPDPYMRRYVTARQIEASLPDAVGAFVEWLVRDSGWTVTERVTGDLRVPIEARHICLLFRRFLSYGEDITRPYVQALEARGIRHLLVGGRTFHDREEIETLRAALMAVEWPEDQLSVFATLRGALFAIGDEELLEYRDAANAFHPFRVPAGLPVHLQPVREALEFLASLHRQRNRRPVADTISALLEHTRAHVGFVLRPGGEQALANVLHVAELARQYELQGGMSFRGFVDILHAEASVSQPAEAPILEEGSDGVRLMTVHKAKGLEFPVVILADITARMTPTEPSRHVDRQRQVCALRIGGWSPRDLIDSKEEELSRERAEGERIAYVAATRARDLLVVPGVGDEPYEEGWIAPLNTAAYPPENMRRQHLPAPGCPAFKSRDTVRVRPDGDPASPRTVCPGLHHISPANVTPGVSRADTPDQSVSLVWWAPDALTLDVEAQFGLRRDDLIVKDVPAAVLRQQLDEYHSWKANRQLSIDAAAQPSIAVITATEWARRDPSPAGTPSGDIGGVEVTIESALEGGPRPGGRRFGTLIHALLAEVPLPVAGDSIASLAAARGRVLGATSEEVVAAQRTVRHVLGHPVLVAAARAAGRGACYREMPVTWRVSTETLIEGNVDLTYIDGEEVVVVDFKTDRELDGNLDVYRRQVQVYAAAVGSALEKRPRGVLLRV